MRQLNFIILKWIESYGIDDPHSATLAALCIEVGADGVPITRVHDKIYNIERDYIIVPVYDIAQWLILNYWYILQEQKLSENEKNHIKIDDWYFAHSTTSIGGGFDWPLTEFYGTDTSIHVHSEIEQKDGVSLIRYLNNIDIDIPIIDFKESVHCFVSEVLDRLSSCFPNHEYLFVLKAELDREIFTAKQISFNLKQLAGFNGLTDEEIIQKTSIDSHTYNLIKSERMICSDDILECIAEVLHIDVDELVKPRKLLGRYDATDENAVASYCNGEISTGVFAKFMGITRQEAMKYLKGQ